MAPLNVETISLFDNFALFLCMAPLNVETMCGLYCTLSYVTRATSRSFKDVTSVPTIFNVKS